MFGKRRCLSRCRIRSIMKSFHLVFVYKNPAFRLHPKGKNNVPIPNHLARQLNQEKAIEAIVIDLTCVYISGGLFLMIDHYNREIISLSIRWHKISKRVKQVIQSMPCHTS